jgi:hypothetical protein
MAESVTLNISALHRLVTNHQVEFMQEYAVHSVCNFISGYVCGLDEEECKNLSKEHQKLIMDKNAYVVVLLNFYDKIHPSQQKELVDDPVNVINSTYECALPESLQPYRAQIKAVAIKQPPSTLL